MLGLIAGFFGKLFGTVVESTVKTGETVVEQAGSVLVAATKDPGDLASARQFAPVGSGGGLIRSFADGISCLIRPGLAIFLILVVAGGITPPTLDHIDPRYLDWFERIMTFWFGQRAAIHDLPRLISSLRGAFKS